MAHHAGYDGEAFVACYSGAIVRVNRIGEVLGKIHLHEGAVKALRIHPHEPLAASCSADGASSPGRSMATCTIGTWATWPSLTM